MEDNHSYDRYIRQINLPELGRAGQEKLAAAKVLVVGAGGLGNPVLQYLAAAGVGTIGISDGDKIELSNLHRQPLFSTADIGKPKAAVAAAKISAINPLVSCISHGEISNLNAFDLFVHYDIIVDCTDNFTAHYTVNDACFLMKKPLVFAAVFRYEGQLAVFNTSGTQGPVNYRDLFPEPPSQDQVPDCDIAGVLGVLPGLIGMMQAIEVIKLVTGIGDTLSGKLLSYDIRNHNSAVFELSPSPRAMQFLPADRNAFEQMDYQLLCGEKEIAGIDKILFDEWLSDPATLAIDVREYDEKPEARFPHLSVPLSIIDEFMEIPDNRNLLLFCQTGKRSAKAAVILKRKFGASRQVFHLKGGLTAYYSPEHG